MYGWAFQALMSAFDNISLYASAFHIMQNAYQLLAIPFSANHISDGDNDECDDDGPSPEDSRKVQHYVKY